MVKNLSANAGDTDLTFGSGRAPGEGNGNPLQYSCLGNSKDRGVLWATVHGIAEELNMTYCLNKKKRNLYSLFPGVHKNESTLSTSSRPADLRQDKINM